VRPARAHQCRLALRLHVAAHERAATDADARSRKVAEHLAAALDQHRLGTAQIALDSASHADLGGADVAQHCAGFADRHVAVHLHVAIDASQNFERALSAHAAAHDSARTDD
jgi:hypothetical protein